MRRFLYLNNDSLYSYISQINDGLPISTTNYNQKSNKRGEELDGIKTSDKNDYALSIEKKLYDEAFDKLKKHLESKQLLKKENLVIGDFFEIMDEMFIVDLEYYKNIFSNNDILDFIKVDELQKRVLLENQNTEYTGNGNKVNYDKGKLEREIKKQIDLEYESIKKTINIIFNIIPYNKFGIMGDHLIVLDDEHFRDKTKVVAYKYGGKMTMLGYITNIVCNDVSQGDDNIFRTFPSIINSFMLSFFNKSEIKIVNPVAIYY